MKGALGSVSRIYIAGMYEWQAGATIKYYDGGVMRRSGYASGNGVFYILSDQLGSTSVIVSQSGTVQATDYYYPFGANRGGSAFSELTTKRFTGQYGESGLAGSEGLSYYGGRWYDTQLGRFISSDTLVPSASNPQAFNRYMYAADKSPTNRLDPNGHADSCNLALYSCGTSSTVSEHPVDYMPHYSTSYQKSYARMIHAYWPQQRAQAKALAEFFKKLNDPFRHVRRSQAKSSNLFGFPFASDLRSPSTGTVPLGPPTPSQNLSRMSPDSPCLMTPKCDYHVLSISAGPIGPITNIYFANQDIYVSSGMNIGAKGLSVSFFSGYIEDQVKTREFLRGRGVSISGGLLFGIGHNWSVDTGESNEGGYYLPGGFGIAQMITLLRIGPEGIVLGP